MFLTCTFSRLLTACITAMSWLSCLNVSWNLKYICCLLAKTRTQYQSSKFAGKLIISELVYPAFDSPLENDCSAFRHSLSIEFILVPAC